MRMSGNLATTAIPAPMPAQNTMYAQRSHQFVKSLGRISVAPFSWFVLVVGANCVLGLRHVMNTMVRHRKIQPFGVTPPAAPTVRGHFEREAPNLGASHGASNEFTPYLPTLLEVNSQTTLNGRSGWPRSLSSR